MLWVIYSLLSAFFLATTDAFTKKISGKIDDYILIWSRFLFAMPFLLLVLFFIPMPKLDLSFFYVLLIAMPFEIAAWIFYIKAIRISPLSLTMPFLTLTPVFLLLTSFLILGEFPTIYGLLGILFVVLGAYLLNIKDLNKGIFAPFKSILEEKGCIYMLLVAFLFSITSNLGKILALKASPLFVSAFYYLIVTLLLIPFILIKSNKKLYQISLYKAPLIITGFFFALMMIFNMLAVVLVMVPYMISIKRTSSIFSILYGHFLFKEKNIRERMIGAVIMLIGAVLIISF